MNKNISVVAVVVGLFALVGCAVEPEGETGDESVDNQSSALMHSDPNCHFTVDGCTQTEPPVPNDTGDQGGSVPPSQVQLCASENTKCRKTCETKYAYGSAARTYCYSSCTKAKNACLAH